MFMLNDLPDYCKIKDLNVYLDINKLTTENDYIHEIDMGNFTFMETFMMLNTVDRACICFCQGTQYGTIWTICTTNGIEYTYTKVSNNIEEYLMKIFGEIDD